MLSDVVDNDCRDSTIEAQLLILLSSKGDT